MAKSSITAFEFLRTQTQTGFRSRRTVSDELFRMETPGGSIYLSKSALERAGDDWGTFKGRIRNLAGEKDIPLADHTAEN